MSYERATIIVNPEAGTHDAEDTARTILEYLEDEGIAGTVRTTAEAADTSRFAKEAMEAETDLVVVAGGDGTIMDAVGVLANSGTPLLPLPLGTWNGLVRMLGAPMSIEETLVLCLAGEVVEIDLGYVPEVDRYFLLWAGAGIDAEVMAGAARDGKKKKWGYWAYLGALSERLGGSKNRDLELEIDGDVRTFYGHTVLAFNVNDLRFAGLHIGPVVSPYDGKMDLTVLTQPSVWGTLAELGRVLTSGSRQNGGKKDRTWIEASRVRIDANPPLDVQADGDVIGRTPLTLELLPRALSIQAPAKYAAALLKADKVVAPD